MDTEEPKPEELMRLFAAMAPPHVPDAAFSRQNADLFRITSWKKTFAISVLAGLLTDPRYYANGIRLDWLQRLVFSKAEGRQKPTPENLEAALNAGLERAGVLRLEDPCEDSFCSLIATPLGNFRIFCGQWELAGPYTQTLFDAFLALPSSSAIESAYASVYAALRLSDDLAERSGAIPLSKTGGTPQGVFRVPNADTLKKLARRVRFTDADIDRLGIDKAALIPFLMEPENFQYVSDRTPGDTPLEFHPLLETSNGVIVASPAGISVAIRALLVSASRGAGVERGLCHHLLRRQEEYSETSGFWPLSPVELSRPDGYPLGVGVCQYAEGHFLQIIQLPVTFDGFPRAAFGSVVGLSDDTNQAVANYVHEFWQLLAERSDCRSSTTAFLLSGWGAPRRLAPPIDHAKAPTHWQHLYLSFHDAAVLGTCDDGKFSDIVRILKQLRRLEADGFKFRNPSGIVNLFGFWRLTGGHLVPEHGSDIAPPCNLAMPTNSLLEPRLEAIRKADVRAMPLPEAGFQLVQRIDWSDDDPKPIYGSLHDARRGRMRGSVTTGKHVWWVECVADREVDHGWQYRLWHAVLEWLAAVATSIITAFPRSFPAKASGVELSIPSNSALTKADLDASKGSSLAAAVAFSPSAQEDVGRITVSTDWLPFLQRRENDAEVELVASVLEAIADPAHPIARVELASEVLRAVGSRDWRWLHAHPAITPMDILSGHGLVQPFHRIPLSAITLAKCGSVWGFRRREEGLEINGEEACRIFLAQYRDHVLDDLVQQIRKYNRQELVILSAESSQSARIDQQSWRGTIRALRAISGPAADVSAFKQQNEISAVQRAAKAICEIAACEAREVDGLCPGRLELEELFAKALLLIGNGQLFVTIRAGLVEPKLRISPAGDLLSDRSVFEITHKPAIESANKRTLDEAASGYGQEASKDRTELASGKPRWSAEMTRALESEYGDSEAAFVNLQYALVQIAVARREDVFAIRRSELCALLEQTPTFPAGDHAGLLERLTLPKRRSWRDISAGLTESDIELTRLDRRFSLINRPLLALDNSVDPLVLVAPIIVADAMMYSLSGLLEGTLTNDFWVSDASKSYAGARGKAAGEEFEESVAEKLRSTKMEAWVRCKLSWALNQKVDQELGDIDVLAISADRKRVWVIEAKNLRLCRTEAEVASRMSEDRGRTVRNKKSREEPDKMLRHIRRVQYLREHRSRLCHRLKLNEPPEIRGLLIVDAPQPMNFHMLEKLEDGGSAFLGDIEEFEF